MDNKYVERRLTDIFHEKQIPYVDFECRQGPRYNDPVLITHIIKIV